MSAGVGSRAVPAVSRVQSSRRGVASGGPASCSSPGRGRRRAGTAPPGGPRGHGPGGPGHGWNFEQSLFIEYTFRLTWNMSQNTSVFRDNFVIN